MGSKWKEPTDRAGREQYRALRAELKSRKSLRKRTEIMQDLDTLFGTSLSDNGSHPAPTAEESRVPSVPVAGARSASDLDRRRTALQPLLSTRTLTPETVALATECAAFTRNLFDKKWADLTPEQQAGMVVFQLDVWSGTKSTPETLAILDEVCGTAGLK